MRVPREGRGGQQRRLLSILVVLISAPLAIAVAMFASGGQVLGEGNGSPAECTNAEAPGVQGDPVSTFNAAPDIVTAVCIKSGAKMFGGNKHSDVLAADGDYEGGCYTVSGIGTSVVTVTRNFSGPNCQQISHIDVVTGPAPTPAAPTPTPTEVPPAVTPTPTPSPAALPAAPLPAALPETGSEPGVGAGSPAQAALLALTGLALIGGSAWAMASLRRKEID